jgi:hypothetical protein
MISWALLVGSGPGRIFIARRFSLATGGLLTLRFGCSDEQRSAGYNDYLKMVPDELLTWWTDYVCQMFCFLILV